MARRTVPLIVVASPAGYVADQVAARLRRDGAVVYATHSQGGCLRVATSIAPDMVLLDPVLPKRLEQLLRAHPATANARIVQLSPGFLNDLSHAAHATQVALAAA
ncbi:MAG: hypothetical protein JOY61_02190 [Chloroflexi bacterium]|nr:hypothetical protein [Chloroflexota bacterium]